MITQPLSGRSPDEVIAAALRSLHCAGWDDVTRRYAEDSWAAHEIAAGDGSGAVRALVAVSSDASPGTSLARWVEHGGAIEKLLGAKHPDTLATRGNLAQWRGRAGDPAGAREMFDELVPLFKGVLGAKHPYTLITRSNRADWRGEAGDAAGAAKALAKLLPLFKELLGAKHPETLTIRNNLAAWRGEVGDAAGAAKALAKLLPLREGVLGAEHPDTLVTHSNLAYWRGEAGAVMRSVLRKRTLSFSRCVRRCWVPNIATPSAPATTWLSFVVRPVMRPVPPESSTNSCRYTRRCWVLNTPPHSSSAAIWPIGRCRGEPSAAVPRDPRSLRHRRAVSSSTWSRRLDRQLTRWRTIERRWALR